MEMQQRETPLIIEYTNILRQQGLNSEQARAFREQYKDDPVFVRRADALDKLWELKKELGR